MIQQRIIQESDDLDPLSSSSALSWPLGFLLLVCISDRAETQCQEWYHQWTN